MLTNFNGHGIGSFSKSVLDWDKPKSVSPGPTDYNLSQRNLEKGIKIFQSKRDINFKQSSPGPSDYNTLKSSLKNKGVIINK